jgi:hypothetical protein
VLYERFRRFSAYSVPSTRGDSPTPEIAVSEAD